MSLGGLILLGLLASIFLVFSENVQFVRVGLVAALWAAAIGALAATKYRKEAAIGSAKARDLQTVYELQLEREVTARREYELGVEARVRAEVGADADQLTALRAELAVLRQSLQRLFDGGLPQDRPALRADATRIQELTGSGTVSANDSSADAKIWAVVADQQPPGGTTPVFEPDHPAPPAFASPFDEPVTAETDVVSPEDGEIPGPAGPVESRGWADSGIAPGAASPGRRTTAPTVASQSRPTNAPTVGIPGRRQHRRRGGSDDATSSRRLSVAEIMANLQSEDGQQR